MRADIIVGLEATSPTYRTTKASWWRDIHQDIYLLQQMLNIAKLKLQWDDGAASF